jgi:hypothetical protein
MGKKIVQAICALCVLLTTHQAYAAPKYKEFASDKKYKSVVHVRPDGVNEVPVSTREINHILSDYNINNIKLPEDSNLSIDIQGKNAFLQCKSTTPDIIYISTKGNIYTLRIKPTAIGAQKIHLVGNINNAVTKLHGNKREKLAVEIIKAAFAKGKLLEKARESRLFRHRRLIKDIIIKEHRRYDFEEDRLTLKVYIVKLADSFKYPKFKVTEKNFLIPDLTKKPIGIALSRDYLTKNDYVRLFILGRH